MNKPNVLMIVIDSLRADKCYGNKKTSLTPNIDLLIKNGAYFEQTISSAASTSLAVASIFTGLYPFKIGMGGETYHKINSSITNFVEIFKKNGYTTFSTAPSIAEDFGLTCNFQNNDSTYDNYFGLFSGLGKQIVNTLESKKLNTPWFFYIHIYDLHTPIVLPKQFDNQKYGESQYEKMLSAIDFWIGNFLKKINLDETLVAITADHGEYIPIVKIGDTIINNEPSAAETNIWNVGNRVPSILYPIKRKMGNILRKRREKHKSSKISNLSLTPSQKRNLIESRMSFGHRMFDDLIKVPLIFSGLKIPSNIIISNQVRHVDIFPTIFDLISISFKSNIDGKSLVPILNNSKVDELPASIESPPSIHNESKKSIGIRTSNFKYIRDLVNSGEILELYDLKNDSLEEHNIANINPKTVQKMENMLQQQRKNEIFDKDESMTDDEIKHIENKLKKLGYR